MRPSGSTEQQASPVSIGTGLSKGSRVTSPSLSGSPPIPKMDGTDSECGSEKTVPPPVQLRTIGSCNPTPEQPKTQQGRVNGSRHTSGGGVQVVLDETTPWNDLSVNPQKDSRSKPSGMLGFLSKRRGRASSPKPMERGVLGREGARVVIT